MGVMVMPRPRKRARPGVSKEDADLAESAKAKAGSVKKLAEMFTDLSIAAVSEWGRTRDIPRHVRPVLRAYVRGQALAAEWEEFPGILKGLERLRVRQQFAVIAAIETILNSYEASEAPKILEA
jgi:hypothetical protein